jgi:hypothetical protein
MSKTPGLALADLAKLSEDVPVGDSHITVTGISISKALDIVKRFPELAKLASGFKVADLLLVAPGALAAIIATATGHHGDAEQEAFAADIPIETQFDIVEAVGRLTFRNGFAPFAQRLLDLAQSVRSDLSTKATSMSLHPALKNSSPPDTAPQMSGTTPPDKSPPSSSSPTSAAPENVTPA